MRFLDRSLNEFEFSIRSLNALRNADIRTLRDLVTKTEAQLLRTKNFGRKSLADTNEVLTDLGLHLGMRDDDEDDAPGVLRKP